MMPMEYEALRWRSSRLEEYGYVTRDEAFAIYKVLSPTKLRDSIEEDRYTSKLPIDLRPDQIPVVATVNDESRFFFFQALSRVEDDELVRRLSMEFIGLQNRAAIADGVEPGDADSAQDVVERTAGYLSLGLSFLSRHDLEKAPVLLATVKLVDIFRAGFAAVWIVSRNASKMRHRPTLTLIDGEKFSLLEPRDAQLFESVTQVRPTVFLDAPDVFREQAQLDATALRIATIALKQLWAFSIREYNPASLAKIATSSENLNEPDHLTFDLMLRTALSNVLLDRDLDAPLDSSELNRLASRLREAPWGDDLTGFFEPVTSEFPLALPATMLSLSTRWVAEQVAHLSDELSPVVAVEDAQLFAPVVLVRA
jgi:hypothetical protein